MAAFNAVPADEVVVIGAGQAGLSAAHHLARQGFAPGTGFVVLDGETRAAARGSTAGRR